jgi:hypothetical protein
MRINSITIKPQKDQQQQRQQLQLVIYHPIIQFQFDFNTKHWKLKNERKKNLRTSEP